MGHFSKSSLQRIIRNILPDNMKMSSDVPEILEEILIFYAEEISEKAIRLCRLEGKKTLKKEHFKTANKLFLSEVGKPSEEEDMDLSEEVLEEE